HSVGARLDPDGIDLFFFGGGQDREQETVGADLVAGAGHAIREAVDRGAALLSVCGGYQLLGRFFRTSEGTEIPGAGLFDVYTVAGTQRHVGNVIAEAKFDADEHQLVGFENHSGQTFIGEDSSSSSNADTETTPLARVLVGSGNNGTDRLEGARYKGAIGTYLHGPVL